MRRRNPSPRDLLPRLVVDDGPSQPDRAAVAVFPEPLLERPPKRRPTFGGHLRQLAFRRPERSVKGDEVVGRGEACVLAVRGRPHGGEPRGGHLRRQPLRVAGRPAPPPLLARRRRPPPPP